MICLIVFPWPQTVVTYLSLFSLHKIFEFLEVAEMNVKSNLTRILPDKISDKLENYEEVAQTLSGTEYETYLT